MSHTSITEIRPYTPAELARLYGVSKATFNKWLKPHRDAIGQHIGHFYTTLQVKIMFEKLGPPFEHIADE
ncbi:MAG TPA: hypothetical protein VGM41_17315 [Chitinophagaceae bacterium]|jgi:hypothetical protein